MKNQSTSRLSWITYRRNSSTISNRGISPPFDRLLLEFAIRQPGVHLHTLHRHIEVDLPLIIIDMIRELDTAHIPVIAIVDGRHPPLFRLLLHPHTVTGADIIIKSGLAPRR